MAAHTLTTLHGRLDLPDLRPLHRKFPEFPLVSISNQQRLPMPPVNWAGTVYHGLPPDLLRFNPSPQGDYLAFLGRISPEKGPDRAIEIARRANMKIRIAAKVDGADRQYFEQHIRHLLDDPLVEFIGEIGEHEKSDFLGNASALLFPVNWPEPFGIVMIEAMACGTPVIAWPEGSVPEIIDPGVTGFLVRSMEEAVAALGETRRLDRFAIRRRFEQRFSAARMARDYVALYRKIARTTRPHIAVPQIQRSADRAVARATPS
jgi:glycosyltransferase involved in cell wall biosynthesis